MIIVDDATLAEQISSLRAIAKGVGRDVGVYASGHIVCRPTQKEAEDYYEYYAVEMADQESVDTLQKIRLEGQSLSPGKANFDRRRMASGGGTFPVVGDPDFVADTLSRFSNAGLDGMAFGLVKYVDELPFIAAEVLPRMERLGSRQAAA